MNKQRIPNVKKYFETHVNDCFTNAYASVISHLGHNPNVLLADYLSFLFDEGSGMIGVNFLLRDSPSVEFTSEELNTSLEFAYLPGTTYYSDSIAGQDAADNDRLLIRFFIHDDPNLAYSRLKTLITSGTPVIVVVDLHEMRYHKAYQKEHGLHAIVITGFDEEADTYTMFDRYPLASSDFSGELLMSEVNRGRMSDTPLRNPLNGEYKRPVRHLWIEIDIHPTFAIREEKLRALLAESGRRLCGRRKLFGQECGLARIDAFRHALLDRRDHPLDERGIYVLKTYYFNALRSVSRNRRRFAAFLREIRDVLPDIPVSGMEADLETSARSWEICANLCLKSAISKKLSLLVSAADHLQTVIRTEAGIADRLMTWTASTKEEWEI